MSDNNKLHTEIRLIYMNNRCLSVDDDGRTAVRALLPCVMRAALVVEMLSTRRLSASRQHRAIYDNLDAMVSLVCLYLCCVV